MMDKNYKVLSDEELHILNSRHWILFLGKNSDPYGKLFKQP